MTEHKFKIRKNKKRTVVVDRSGRYKVELVGQGAEVRILGAFRLKGKQRLAIDIEVVHRARNTRAKTAIRVVVGGRARAEINGQIRVAKGAQQTNSFLEERVLLVSDKARAEAVPNLEIEADEVQCSHAATVGSVDSEQLFYLMSRGLTRTKAEALLVEGFLAPVRELISELS